MPHLRALSFDPTPALAAAPTTAPALSPVPACTPPAPGTAASIERLLDEMREAFVHVDPDWRVKSCNQAYARLVGKTIPEILGKTPDEFLPNFVRTSFHEPARQATEQRIPVAHLGYAQGASRWVMARFFPVSDGVVVLANEAAPNVVRDHQLAQAATKDALTGLDNKLQLVHDIKTSTEGGKPFEVIVVGLRGLGALADDVGFAGADIALCEITTKMRAALRPKDMLYRIGDHDFVVLSPREDAHPWNAAERILEAITRPVTAMGRTFFIGASAGCVCSVTDGGDPERMLRRAALALRKAKAEQRGGFYPFHRSLEREVREHALLEADLRRAIIEDEFTIVLQPQASLDSGEIESVEALVRWQHPEHGQLLPAEFLSVARTAGLMRGIDKQVIAQVLELIPRLHAEGLRVPVVVNLSAESLAHQLLPSRIERALAGAGVSPDQIEIDVTEDALMQDEASSQRSLAEFHAMGVRVNLAEFGSGAAPFDCLTGFNLASMKIDARFMQGMRGGSAGERVVRGMVQLARAMHLRVVAEGVETHAQLTALKAMSCDSVQGFAYARPMDLEGFVRFARWRAGHPGAPSVHGGGNTVFGAASSFSMWMPA